MKKILALIGLLVGLIASPILPVAAQQAVVSWQCVSGASPGSCPANLTYPLPVQLSSTTATSQNQWWTGAAWTPSLGDATGGADVQGAVPSLGTDSGNPIKVGCVNNTTLPTVANAQRVDCQADTRGGQFVVLKGLNSASSVATPTPGDTATASVSLSSAAFGEVWNGTNWDRVRPYYQLSQTPITGIGTGTTGAVVGTLAGVASKTTYICGFDVSGIGGTAAIGPVVVAGLTGGSFTYQLSSSAAGVTFSKEFTPCIPASAVNTAITVTTTADGTATAVDVNAHGFQL